MTNNELSTGSRSLNILCLSEHFFPLTGGTVTYTANTCENLAKLGNNVFLVTSSPDHKTFPPNKWINKNNYYIYNVGVQTIYNYNTRIFRILLCKEVEKLIYEIINNKSIDIVHVLYGHYLPRIFKKKHLSLPIIWTIHNVPPQEYSPYNKIWLPILNIFVTKIYFGIVKINNYLKFKLYKYDTIITPSEYVKQLLLSQGLKPDKITMIPNGIDGNFFKPDNQPINTGINIDSFPKILCVAPILKHKGIHVLLNAIYRVQKEYPMVSFINIGLIGEQSYKQTLDKLINSYQLSNNCIFITKKVTENVLRDYYNHCDIYVQPSLEEGFCLSILEAASCGNPIIGTKTGGIPEIVKTTELNSICLTNDAECLAKNILDISKCLREKPYDKQKQHKKIVDIYSWPKNASTLLSLYYVELEKQTSIRHSNNKY